MIDDNQKRDLMDAIADAIHLLTTMDEHDRHRAISVLQYIYACLEDKCRGDKHDPS
jgi:hypothetical protein